MTMQVIQHIELGSSASSITFSSIPQTYTDLRLVLSFRATDGGVNSTGRIQFNASSSGFSGRNLLGTGSGVESYNIGDNWFFYPQGNGTTSNTFDNQEIYIPNYTSSANKSFSVTGVTENNATGAIQAIWAGLWSNTAAITSISLTGSTWAAGSSATLYGITAGSSGGVTVS